jgi:hypothetical protein
VAGSKPDNTGLKARTLRPAARQCRSKAQVTQVLPMSVPVPVIKKVFTLIAH